MRRQASETRQRILDGAYQQCYASGFARASVDAIAARAGITKRTLYQHFDSKDSLLDAVLAQQHALMIARIEHWLDPAAGSPAAMVEGLFVGLARWVERAGWRGSGFSRAALEFADLPGHPARRAARRHKGAVEASLATALGSLGHPAAETTARQLMLLIEGAMTLALIHADPAYVGAAAEAAGRLVGQSPA
ncbi:MAG: TetR/AcrR family transcriptional regulator [Rhodocyclaceae bacterium]|nr:TetR/AcrR family transcriptional regulator [Rhodocyclaceae bacterium]